MAVAGGTAEYLARGAGDGKRPGLLVIHEVFGVDDWIRQVADRYAAQGYDVLAPDLFTGRVHARFTPEVAHRVMPVLWQLPVEERSTVDNVRRALKGHRPEEIEIAAGLAALNLSLEWVAPAMKDLRTAVGKLRALPTSNGRVGSIGFCFGGRASFQLACAEPALGAAVVFYGTGPREEDIERIACPVLGLYGSLDEHVTKDVPRVARMMGLHGKAFEHEVYDRTGHAFARAGSKAFHEENARKAWARADAFLASHLR